MTNLVSAEDVRDDLLASREIALIDLREEDPFARAHPLFAAQLPLSRLEIEVLDRIPRKDVKIVLYDDGEGLVAPAIATLEALGYSNVHALRGGLSGWRAAGYELFQDVNSYSKAFGELVEARQHTPSLPARQVKSLIDKSEALVILDARRFEEYNTMSIPGGISTPGAELVLRARALAPDPGTTIIVNCAGRTRSLIGAQSLVNAGVPNPVYALRNGTIGWTLAGQELERGQTRRAVPVSATHADDARAAARDVAYRAGVKHIGLSALQRLAQDAQRTLYRFDVRPPDEYEAGHIAGFRSAPGGQLVQETDMFAPVRGARIALADDIGPRADMTASWLAQMGWDVYVLDGGFEGDLQTGAWRPTLPPIPGAPGIGVAKLADALKAGEITLIDIGTSSAHRQRHVPGARFAIRAQLRAATALLPEGSAIVLTSSDGVLARLAAGDLSASLKQPVHALIGGTDAWIRAGYPVETGLQNPLSPPEDIYKRPYEGTDNAVDAMQAYLDWEYGLIDQLARDGTHGFYVI